MMFAWILIILILLSGISAAGQKQDSSPVNSAADILRQRFARGEISQQEYQQMKKVTNKV